METGDVRYWGTGAELRCGALEVCQKEVAGSVPGFWILFSFFNVSFESHWLDARSDKARFLPEHLQAPSSEE